MKFKYGNWVVVEDEFFGNPVAIVVDTDYDGRFLVRFDGRERWYPATSLTASELEVRNGYVANLVE
jgi:hypothetical protein